MTVSGGGTFVLDKSLLYTELPRLGEVVVNVPTLGSNLALFKFDVMDFIDSIVPFLHARTWPSVWANVKLVPCQLCGVFGGGAYILKFPPNEELASHGGQLEFSVGLQARDARWRWGQESGRTGAEPSWCEKQLL